LGDWPRGSRADHVHQRAIVDGKPNVMLGAAGASSVM